jgi:hypothetical protein
MPSPPWEERASALLVPNDWGEGGMKQPFFWAVTLFHGKPLEFGAAYKRKTTLSWGVGLP